MSLIYNASFDSQTRILSLLDKAGNVISSCEVPSKELVDDPNKPLMLRAIEDSSSVSLKKYGTLSNTYQTSTNGKDWTDYTLETQISLNKGESVYFRCSNHPTTQTAYDYVHFEMAGKIEAWHNAYSMISSDFSSAEGEVGVYGMNGLFESCRSLTKAPLLLNALSPNCYFGTFYGCGLLTQAPALPATALAERCYRLMFAGCQSLKEVRVAATTTATDALLSWLSNVSATGDFYCDPNATIFPRNDASGIPSGWTRRDINLINALTLTATANNSSVKLTKNGTLDNTFEVDTGNGWTAYEFDTVIPLNAGQSCKWRCSAHPTTQSSSNYISFVMTGTIEASGNINSMLDGKNFGSMVSLSGYDYAFYNMFQKCTSLTQAPALPATTLSAYCYARMFLNCESLTQVPVLPATTLADGCYWSLFQGCGLLTKAPELPATELATDCYYTLFSGCRSLKEVRVSATKTATRALTMWLHNVSSTGDFYCDPNATIFPTGGSGIPSGWRRIPPVDDPSKPLTFKATQDGSTVTLTQKGSPSGSFQTSRDGGKTWVDYTLNTTITLSNGDEVSFRAKADRTSGQDEYNYFGFQMTGKIEAWHNIMSLYRTNDFATYKSVVDYAFAGLFSGCTSLTKAPLLPATTLADSCYWAMFQGTSLTKAPELPATELVTDCYYTMFQGCRSLKEVRVSATTTASHALYIWLRDVSATGDFYCDPNATIFPSGESGCPSGWTRRNIADYPN